MSQPNQKGNFIQTLLLMTTLFLGFQLLMNRNQGSQPVYKSSGEVLTKMRELASTRFDVDIVSMQHTLSNQVSDEVKTKKITKEEGDKLEIEALVLTAGCQLRAGINSQDLNRMELSYNTIARKERELAGKPIWTEAKFDIPADFKHPDKFPAETWTGHDLHEHIVKVTSAQSKSDLVWGVIPGYAFIDSLVALTGRVPGFSYAFAALLLAIGVRLAILKLTMRQIMFGRMMSELTPLLKEIKEKYKDAQEQQVKTMELYREYGINPLAGCLPAFIQLPLFITVYRCMLHYRFEFQKGTFLWINASTGASSNGFFAANLGQQDNVLIVLYGVSMIVSTLLMPVSDPTQVKQQKGIGLFMAVFFSGSMLLGFFPVPSAFVLYWTFTNVLATAQSLYAYRLPRPELKKVNAPNGGVYPADNPVEKFFKRLEGIDKKNAGQSGSSNGKPSSLNGMNPTNGKSNQANPGDKKKKKDPFKPREEQEENN